MPNEPNEPNLTLGDFRATGRDVPDLGAALSDAPRVQPGRVYLDSLYVETRPEGGWPNGDPRRYYLQTDGQAEWLSDDLPRLEALLYEFALAEGYLTEPTPGGSVTGRTALPKED